jgi:hypothetical protein
MGSSLRLLGVDVVLAVRCRCQDVRPPSVTEWVFAPCEDGWCARRAVRMSKRRPDGREISRRASGPEGGSSYAASGSQKPTIMQLNVLDI